MLGLAAISEVAICELPLPFVPPPVVVPPNMPGGAIIYAVAEPCIIQPVTIADYRPRSRVSVSDPNPTIMIYIGRDLSEASDLALTLADPQGSSEIFSANVLVGQNQMFTPAGLFPADAYAVYVFGGEIDQAGTWSATLTWQDASGSPQTSGRAQFDVSR